MPPFLMTLLANGLGLIGNAVLAKGKDVIEKELGVDLEKETQTPEGLQKLTQMQNDHEEKLLELALADKALDVDNTKNARDSNVKIQEAANASWLAKNAIYLIAFTVIAGGGWMLYVSRDADVRMYAASAITMVLGFFFGTTNNRLMEAKGKGAQS